ncbi:crossover junction endonuclease MUS81 [Tribolium castaneum]|uniref:Crossover junction endonuclease MUS81 n=1 Tax=Tribolium castaneum TaxID=7070 RepID=D6WBZ9_TRICA|nr:PREDICTED: crossover junction endonuclease MUS81 [Tribolium castaneum]EEZ99114.1 Crossover junction endonuclease MUS81-like Protein [Tribolium castaneum]|eukprot:XP_967772.1 PREDICTED: crossover junction endonuclease MUS81 [Tribolium castaneum]
MSRKRITVKAKHPNPLFERWLIEWRDKAKENDSKMQHCFSMALKSLKNYPLPLETGKDCKILKGFGEKLCKMLDDKLKQFKANENTDIVTKVTTPKKTKPKEYIPQPGSGAFAILLTLYEKSLEPNYPGHLTKADVIKFGQHLCNVSFTKAGPDTRYTAWSSMKTLLEKNLVVKRGNPAKFSLTEEGTVLADKLFVQKKIEEFQNQDNSLPGPSCSSLSKTNDNKEQHVSPTPCSASNEAVILAPNSFDIILLVDNQELNGSNGDVETDPIIMELKKLNVRFETRNLKVGDYAWICRDFISNHELILPYIVERKRMDDLGCSIKDSRFHEQKFRLKQCGIPNLIYLVESYGKNEHVGLPLTTLYQAATNTLVQDNFIVRFTNDTKASCGYLASLTKFLEKLFKPKTLVGCQKDDLQEFTLDDDLIQLMRFADFNISSSKTRHFKIKEMFVKQLLKIKGVSVEKALAVVEKYQTPKNLKLAYSEISEVEGEKLLSTLQFGANKKFGPVLSKTVYKFFCNNY